MDPEIFNLVTKYRIEGKCEEGMELALGILKTYGLSLEQTDLSTFSDNLKHKFVAMYYDISIMAYYTKYREY